MPNSTSGQKYASGFNVTYSTPCGHRVLYQLSTAQWPHYGFNGCTGCTDIKTCLQPLLDHCYGEELSRHRDNKPI